MAYAIQTQRMDSTPLVVIRRQARGADISRAVTECCGLVWTAVGAQQAKAGRNVAVYWDDGVRLEVGVELPGAFTEEGEVLRSATPAGTVASVTHFGSYGGLGAAHDAIHRWARTNGHRLAGPRWEIYGHWLPEWNDNPSQVRTDIYYLLADA